MALSYDHDTYIKALAPVLDEHGEWLGRVMRRVFYPELEQVIDTLAIPDSFRVWSLSAGQDETLGVDVLEGLKRLHADLDAAGAALVQESSAAKSKPDFKKFDAFITLYEEFIAHVRRLDRDLMASGNGIDVLTGLRSRQMLMKDLEREMERRARRGRPFCLALARVDHYAEMKANLPQEDYETVIKAISAIIKQCMRSFDDAYRLSNGEFLMSLKQTDKTGGAAALTRLRKLLEENAPYYTMNGQEKRLTMSSCVAEPQPGDDFETMMGNMRQDLDRFGGDAETALEYIEMSPLERFVNTLEEESKKTH
ncbi:MAG: diguanylate cyclase [Micavibrio aeruginosavorus]|nr:diguanylate cyclase [Micavibrio aeruginosavorus]